MDDKKLREQIEEKFYSKSLYLFSGVKDWCLGRNDMRRKFKMFLNQDFNQCLSFKF